jgi:aminoglycoside 6'-N-acetyltransferase I
LCRRQLANSDDPSRDERGTDKELEGSEAQPVGYIEGWYVDPDMRRRGVGRALVKAAEAWSRALGCRQMASDAKIDNDPSIGAHAALGYREVARAVHFSKDL